MPRLLGFVCAILAVAAVTARAGSPPREMDAIIQSLVRDLGAERYDRRQRASGGLRRVGAPAIPALEKAAQSDDPEVRIRARQILADVRLGIHPDWPADLVLLIRHYENLSDQEKQAARQRLVSEVKAQAVPFIVHHLQGADENEARHLLQMLHGLHAEDAAPKVAKLIPAPKSDAQAAALAWALSKTGKPRKALEVLVGREIEHPARNEAIEAGVQQIIEQLRKRQHTAAAKAAARFAKLAPDDARFLYLQAEAAEAMDQAKEAAELRKRALARQPKAEAPHYAAGELLGKLDRPELAAREWQRILDIPPTEGVYDINAWLRLGAIHKNRKRFGPAADCLEKALAAYQAARQGGHGMGMLGGTVQELQQEINRLRQRAADEPALAPSP
jgi:tetratricopeptide (TPR) repeat protein